jgi:N6-adenosine-specific RNA methylase IME4
MLEIVIAIVVALWAFCYIIIPITQVCIVGCLIVYVWLDDHDLKFVAVIATWFFGITTFNYLAA